ncbi:hypothetical protein HYH03_004461 [Edaphochlamys debaryana]|uniref:Uncharacterized protein n=1 Tax=Edaphochlamys debaryana TaxID=47281 RepID=A0A836C2D4_9CHLO|nr:hypothetical protein HYH03_004461 [Edaphochlamys debaryana]|eukprot:KAG2497725.1 hypothetical protein HYH03_004461 [Edaphochlamys debaryana]
MAGRVVDLTLDSDSDNDANTLSRPAKRARRSPAGAARRSSSAPGPSRLRGAGDTIELLDSDDDDDVEVVDVPRRAPNPAANPTAQLGDDEDLVITGATGQVATRDLPHPRMDCAEHPFRESTSASNAAHCAQCYCFVCDVKASQCRFWGTGARERDHANARKLGYWRRLREAAKAGHGHFILSEYGASGPLGSGIPPQQQQRPQQGGASAAAGPSADERRRAELAQGLASLSSMLRGQAGSAAAAAAPAAAAVPTAPGGRPATGAGGLAAPAAPAAAAVAAEVKPPPGFAQLPVGKCSLRPLPDPAADPNTVELGVLRFGVKAAHGLTVASIAQRLQPHGFHYVYNVAPEAHGDRLSIENLMDSKHVTSKGNCKSKHVYLKLLPLPPPPEEAANPIPNTRLRKVLVIDCLGRNPPTYMGVTVPARAKRGDLLAAMAPMLRPAFSPAAELLHLLQAPSGWAEPVAGHSALRAVSAEQVMDDAWFERYPGTDLAGQHVLVFRTAHHPEIPHDAGPSAAGAVPGPSGSAPEPPLWTAPPRMWQGQPGPRNSQKPTWALVQLRYFRPPGEAPSPLPPPPPPLPHMYGLAAPAPPPAPPSTERLGFPVLIPVRSSHVKGGREAEKTTREALSRAMQAYRTAAPLPASVSSVPSVILRGDRRSMHEPPSAQLPDSARWSRSGEQLHGGYSGGYSASGSSWTANNVLVAEVPVLTAVWPQPLPASAFRLDEMAAPVVDASASAEKFRENAELATEARRREAAHLRRKQLPPCALTELRQASRRPHPEDRTTVAAMGDRACAQVAASLQLRPCAGGRDPRLGELVVRVYAFRSNAIGVRSLFRPWDEWPSLNRRESSSPFPIASAMQLIASGATDAPPAPPTGAGAGPSSSRGAAAAAGSQPSARVRAQRERATEILGRLEKVRDTVRGGMPNSINSLLDFMTSGERPPAEQPAGLTVTMRPYQLQSLAFMLEAEAAVTEEEQGAAAAASPSTLASLADPDGVEGGFRRFFWLPITPGGAEGGAGGSGAGAGGRRGPGLPGSSASAGAPPFTYWYSPILERLCLDVPPQPGGGFLAEEMGLGKTVEVMALTLASPAPPSVVPGAKLPSGLLASRATLVVCAVSLVGQWQAEAAAKTDGSCRIHPYHGPNRIRDPHRLATEFDVVVTTYQTLQSDHGSASDPCQAIRWHRIVFDEGHTLRNAAAKMYKTAVDLSASRRWLCTGTPINNAVDDLMGQFGALQLAPFSKKTYFDSHIKSWFANSAQRHAGASPLPLLYALRCALVRHTKAQSLGGQGVLTLPDKREEDVPVRLSPEEQALYRRVHREAVWGWEKLKAVGPAFVSKHLFTATSMLMPLRRICSGGLLKPGELTVPDAEALVGVARAPEPGAPQAAGADAPAVPVPADTPDCPICFDTLDGPTVTPCNHWFCKECITSWLNSSVHHNCPACRGPVTVAALRRGMSAEQAAAQAAAAAAAAGGGDAGAGEGEAGEGEGGDGIPCVSKLELLLEQLRAMREEDPASKALVFTQFGQSLEWLKPRLAEEGFGYRTITGDMTQKRRTEAISAFQRDPDTCVFLLSMRSGAVGINLTAANHVFLLEPSLNPATEEQAIGRAWRMGQQRPVLVKRLYVQGSVEEAIMAIAKTRRAAGGAGAGGSSGGAAEAGAAASTAGALRQERADLRVSELEQLFAEPRFE